MFIGSPSESGPLFLLAVTVTSFTGRTLQRRFRSMIKTDMQEK